MSARMDGRTVRLEGMQSWKGLHPGMVACHRDKAAHAKWRWGQKKGLRRARRRFDRAVITREISED